MTLSTDSEVRAELGRLAGELGLDIAGGRIRRSSSRFCLGVEHGDYNGTDLFGVGTDRFIWLAWKPNGTNRVRMFSGNFPDDGVVDFQLGSPPAPQGAGVADSWARFVFGTDFILRREGYPLSKGVDAVIYGNIPGGGMSRSASLALNLILTLCEANGITIDDPMRIVALAQMVENDYIGSPCGQLDQIMILLAREGMGTFYHPGTRTVEYVPLGAGAPDFRIVCLDTGTVRPGLEKSTYKVRRTECEQLVSLAREPFGINCLADVRDDELHARIRGHFLPTHPHLILRFDYLFHAQKRFFRMIDAWKAGNIGTVGAIFRADGIGLRDQYQISGPELETMCDIVRSVPGVLGERMLGGGDKGASGALVLSDSIDAVRAAVGTAYPRSHPDLAGRFAVHVCKVVDGIKELDGI